MGKSQLDLIAIGLARADEAARGLRGNASGIGGLFPFILFDNIGDGLADKGADKAEFSNAPVGGGSGRGERVVGHEVRCPSDFDCSGIFLNWMKLN
jgi:hypothetical protein